jgi:hypothetical protein
VCNDFGNNVPYSAYLEAFSQNAGMRPRALSDIDTSIRLGGLRQKHYTHSGTPPGSISSVGVSDKPNRFSNRASVLTACGSLMAPKTIAIGAHPLLLRAGGRAGPEASCYIRGRPTRGHNGHARSESDHGDRGLH